MKAGRDPAPWTAAERRTLDALDSPGAIQRFLDGLEYSSDPIYRAPAEVLRDRKAHCFDGACFAAAALRRLGYPPRLVDLRAVRDDDHVLAVFRRGVGWGAVSKSNFTGLRFREPIFRTLRALVLSYFEDYFNTAGEKTLRSCSRPVSLAPFDRRRWTHDSSVMEAIAARLDAAPHARLLTPAMERALAPVDPRTLEAGLLGANAAGLYRA